VGPDGRATLYRVTLPDGREIITASVGWVTGCHCPGRYRSEHLLDCVRNDPAPAIPAPERREGGQSDAGKAAKSVGAEVTRVNCEGGGAQLALLGDDE
jgi:hypothetical protein